MKGIITYLLSLLLIEIALSLGLVCDMELPVLKRIDILLYCILAGGIGGILYCLRGVYVNASAKQKWDIHWLPWYCIRPIVSLLMGGVSYVFLKAGLLILESQTKPNSSHIAYFALAFVAGLNVDKFIAKIEAVAKTSWGIDKSRAGDDSDK